MCGRFTLRTPMNRLVERFLFELSGQPWEPRFNIAPSQCVASVRYTDQVRQLHLPHWGLVPSWAQDASIGNKLINARAETVSEKPSFRSAFRHRRCLILADGYYEWITGSSKSKQPYYIRRQDSEPFAFAGLWETWVPPSGPPQETCTIITTQANELTRPIHPRMPVILEQQDHDLWLTGAGDDPQPLLDCLRPCASSVLELYPVSTLVNSPRNESSSCIDPLDDFGSEPSGPRQMNLF